MSYRTLQRMLHSPWHLSHRHRAARTLLMLSALLLLTLGAVAEPLTFPTLTTTQGVTYNDVKVSRFDALEVHFTHANGVATVQLSALPPDLQNIFGYNPVNASAVIKARQQERVTTIITDADQKAKAAALLEQEQADAAQLKIIRASPLRCFVNQLTVVDEALLVQVSAADKLPVTVRSKSGKTEHVKRNSWGEPMLVERAVLDQPFSLGDTLLILPQSALVRPQTFITVYLIGTGPGNYPYCALTPEDAIKYRSKLAALNATKPPAPPEQQAPAN